MQIWNIFSTVVTIIFIVITLVGIILGISFRKRYWWRTIKKRGIICLAKKVSELDPDIIITLSGRGGIVTNLVITELENKYPVYTCILKSKIQKKFYKPSNWKRIITSKWNIFLCPDVYKMKNKRILIMDDITSSGETIEELINELVKKGTPRDNIFSMALVADKETHKNKHIPDYYWKIVNIDEYTVPWGKTIINNH